MMECPNTDVNKNLINNNKKEINEKRDEIKPHLDMKHGFIKSIIRNQIDRDEYHKIISENSSFRIPKGKNRKPSPGILLYTPPHLRDLNKSFGSINSEESHLDDEYSSLRRSIRKRLLEKLSKEKASDLMENDEKCSNDTKNYLNNKPLFVMKIFTDRKILFEKIIHSNDNASRTAKAVAQKLELDDAQCRLLRLSIESEQEKRQTS
ncbi:unnamed protein product [Dracunculus medinensis]|uniref:Uncharacterized protein n=1 Tax=Dracunculus medinensis TaxID=318479 RepID=A0A0N4U7K3_DRAME|nr:unnamed protein product [Dracunculus medinensis]